LKRRAIHAKSFAFLEELTASSSACDRTLVSTPAHLNRMPKNMITAAHRPRTVFSSGGPLPFEVAQETERLLGVVPIEVYGSSETGGIAWRQQLAMTDAAWKPMPGVTWRVDPKEGVLEIRSPNLPNEDWFRTADRATAMEPTSTPTPPLANAVSVTLMIGLQFLVFHTRIGTALRAVSYSAEAASLMGIDVDRVISLTFVLGSMLAGAAGVLVGLSNPKIEPLMGIMPGLKAFVAAVVGGIGNIPGAMAGGILMGLSEVLVVGYVSSTYRDAIAFVILILVLLVRPSGLFGASLQEKV
jgi:hypothetical protein